MEKKKENTNLMTMKAYAKFRGVSYELIRRYCKQERITLTDKLIDPEVADKELEENRQSNVIVYVTVDRKGWETKILQEVLNYFTNLLDKIQEEGKVVQIIIRC